MIAEPNTIVKYLMGTPHWQICKYYPACNQKKFYGFDSTNEAWTVASVNKLSGCAQHWQTVAKLRQLANKNKDNTFKLIRTFYITEDDDVIGIDIDKITPEFLSFTIPFPVRSYYVELSPSGTGLHVWCLVAPEIKQQFKELKGNRSIIIERSIPNCKQVEYRLDSCLLTVTGDVDNDVVKSLTIIVAQTLEAYQPLSDEYASVMLDCVSSSEVFKKAVQNDYSTEELSAFREKGLSEHLFSLARVIYQRTGSTDSALYYSILSHLPIVQNNEKWANKKLQRWCEDSTTFEAFKRVEAESSLALTSLTPEEINEAIEVQESSISASSMVVDPKAPDGVLVPLFYKANNATLYPTEVGIYRYSPIKKVYMKHTKAEIVALAEDFYRRLLPHKSASSLHALAQASVRYLYTMYIEELSLAFPHSPLLLDDSVTDHLYIHLADSIYDVESNTYIEETPKLLSTYKLSIPKSMLEHCFNNDNYSVLYDVSKWRAFLESSFNHDKETIESLQRFFGYVISKDFDKQKALVLRGEAGSGKGTLISVISQVLNATIASTSMQQMDEKFGYSTCIDKQLLVFPEMPRNMRKYHGAWERLKALISADPVSVELKGQQAFSTVLHTKVIICSNYDLSYDGDMNSLNRRLVYCTLPQSFGGVKSLEVDYRTLLSTPEEQALILAWIIEGYKLYKKNGLIQSNKGKSALEDATVDTDVIVEFIRRELMQGDIESDFVTNKEIKNAFKRFCNQEDMPVTFRPSDKFLPSKIKSFIARNWFMCATESLEYRTSDGRGIRGVKFRDVSNSDDTDDIPF